MSTIDTSRFGWVQGFDTSQIKEGVSFMLRAESVPIVVWLAIITILISVYMGLSEITEAEIRGFFQKGSMRWVFMGFTGVLLFGGNSMFDIPYSIYLQEQYDLVFQRYTDSFTFTVPTPSGSDVTSSINCGGGSYWSEISWSLSCAGSVVLTGGCKFERNVFQ